VGQVEDESAEALLREIGQDFLQADAVGHRRQPDHPHVEALLTGRNQVMALRAACHDVH